MTHRDGFPRLSARGAGRSAGGPRKPRAATAQSRGKPPPVAQANRRRASESLDDVPHRPRLLSYPPVGRPLLELNHAWRNADSPEARAEIWHQMLKIHADQVFAIGTVNSVSR